MKRKIKAKPSDQVKINCKFDGKHILIESNEHESKMVVMGLEVTVDLGVGYGNIDKVRVSEGYGIQYSEEGIKKLQRLSGTSSRGSQHISELRYRTDRPVTPILEQVPRNRPDTPLTPGGAHVSELHYRHGAISPSLHKTEIAYNIGKYDENQNVFMNISSAPSPSANRPHSGSWGPEPFWAAPHDAEKAKQREIEAKLKTPPPSARVGSPLDNKLAQMAEPSRPDGKGGYSSDRYSSDFDEYKRQEQMDKKVSLLSRRGYNGDLTFDFESDPLLSTRVVKKRRNKAVDRSDSPKRLSDPKAYQEWEDEIARKLNELGHRSTEEEERNRPRTRAEKLSRDTGRMLELMGSEIGGKVKTMRERTDEMMTQRKDELTVDYSAEVEEDDKTDKENINRASNHVMRKLREYKNQSMTIDPNVIPFIPVDVLYPHNFFS